MKEHPILFSTQMVRAILDGYKTQTRRIIKFKRNSPVVSMTNHFQPFSDSPKNYQCWTAEHDEKTQAFMEQEILCPQGFVGDSLWVRETWAHDDLNCKDVKCGNRDHIWWKANESKIVADSFAGEARWRPSIFMPRWASRLTLKIINIRVERIQDITQKDASFEGIPMPAYGEYPLSETADYLIPEFRKLWDSINGKKGFGWDANPFVWVIEFIRPKS